MSEEATKALEQAGSSIRAVGVLGVGGMGMGSGGGGEDPRGVVGVLWVLWAVWVVCVLVSLLLEKAERNSRGDETERTQGRLQEAWRRHRGGLEPSWLFAKRHPRVSFFGIWNASGAEAHR